MNKISPNRYPSGFKWLHWLIALTLIVMLSATFFFEDLPESYQGTAFMIHKSLGLTILLAMILRFIWISIAGRPALPNGMPDWQKFTARFVQNALYFFVILMALCGWIMSVAANHVPSYFGLFPVSLPIEANKAVAHFFNTAHKTIAWVLIVLITMHFSGALFHYFVRKDNVFQRMLPQKKKP